MSMRERQPMSGLLPSPGSSPTPNTTRSSAGSCWVRQGRRRSTRKQYVVVPDPNAYYTRALGCAIGRPLFCSSPLDG